MKQKQPIKKFQTAILFSKHTKRFCLCLMACKEEESLNDEIMMFLFTKLHKMVVGKMCHSKLSTRSGGIPKSRS